MLTRVTRGEWELLRRFRILGTPDPAICVQLTEQITTLKTQLTDLEIQKAQREETHAREDRELRHMIGLEKKRQEVELAAAKRDVELTIRESHLKAEQARFEDHLKFNTARFEKMEEYLKGMLSDILARLPNVSVLVQKKVRP